MLKNYIYGTFAKLFSRKTYSVLRRLKCDKEFLYSFKNSRGSRDYPIVLINSYMNGAIQIGEGTKIWNSKIDSSFKCSIGHASSLNAVSIREAIKGVSIGNYCSIGEGTHIIEFNHHTKTFSSYYYNSNILGRSVREDIESKGEISIGDDVWIGCNCIILSGVTIGRGAVIGAGSVVSSDIEPYSINVGNPIKQIKKRFSQETIEYLESTRWWELPPKELKKHPILYQNTI